MTISRLIDANNLTACVCIAMALALARFTACAFWVIPLTSPGLSVHSNGFSSTARVGRTCVTQWRVVSSGLYLGRCFGAYRNHRYKSRENNNSFTILHYTLMRYEWGEGRGGGGGGKWGFHLPTKNCLCKCCTMDVKGHTCAWAWGREDPHRFIHNY